MSQTTKLTHDEFLAILDKKLEDKLGPISRVMDDLAESVKFISEKFDLITKRIDNLETKYNVCGERE